LGATAIITATTSGHTARMVSKYRPDVPIFAVAARESVRRELALCWGVYPLAAAEAASTDEMLGYAIQTVLQAGLIRSGDLVIITAGVPAGFPGTTNLLKVHIVGDVLLRGVGVGQKPATGQVCVARSAREAVPKMRDGAVLVVRATDSDYIPAMQKAVAIITEEGGFTSHAAVVGINLGIPVIVGAQGATHVLRDGLLVTVDTTRGLVYRGEANIL
ncbi:MAG: pyruvate kinase, partial [Firmicutes bacterium]|nr:pyruvate kinase [Bacillota bacterium]